MTRPPRRRATSGHGGARKGAGRPRGTRTSANLNIRLPADLLERARKHCDARGIVLSDWIRTLIRMNADS